MGTFVFSVFISRPLQEVFDYSANPDNDLQLQKNLLSSEWTTPGPAGLDSIKRMVTRVLGRKIEADLEYMVWDPPNTYTFKSDDTPFSLVGTHKFERKENGTQLILIGQIEVSGILKLVEGLVIRQAKKQDNINLNALKLLLEAG
jgi:ligand-binding SRPBCC domain-containing protein